MKYSTDKIMAKLAEIFKKKETSHEVIEGDITEKFLLAALNTRDRNPVLAITQNEYGYKYLASNGFMTHIEYKTAFDWGTNTMFCASRNVKGVVDEYNSIFIGHAY